MYSKVKRLRRGGVRVSEREISFDPGIVGHMTMFQIETTIIAALHGAGDDARQTPLFPQLFRARVVAMNGDKMLFQGFERVGDQNDPNAQVIKQEWAVQVMADQPKDLARTPHRPEP